MLQHRYVTVNRDWKQYHMPEIPTFSKKVVTVYTLGNGVNQIDPDAHPQQVHLKQLSIILEIAQV